MNFFSFYSNVTVNVIGCLRYAFAFFSWCIKFARFFTINLTHSVTHTVQHFFLENLNVSARMFSYSQFFITYIPICVTMNMFE